MRLPYGLYSSVSRLVSTLHSELGMYPSLHSGSQFQEFTSPISHASPPLYVTPSCYTRTIPEQRTLCIKLLEPTTYVARNSVPITRTRTRTRTPTKTHLRVRSIPATLLCCQASFSRRHWTKRSSLRGICNTPVWYEPTILPMCGILSSFF